MTHYKVLERYQGFAYCEMRLETGRTHQIRVHMSYTGHPLLGDEVYAKNKSQFEKKHPALFAGQCLHARELKFIHPRTKEEVHLQTELPEYFQTILAKLGEAQN